MRKYGRTSKTRDFESEFMSIPRTYGNDVSINVDYSDTFNEHVQETDMFK